MTRRRTGRQFDMVGKVWELVFSGGIDDKETAMIGGNEDKKAARNKRLRRQGKTEEALSSLDKACGNTNKEVASGDEA